MATIAAAALLAVGALLVYTVLSAALSSAVTDELRVRADDVEAEIDAGGPLTGNGQLAVQVVTSDGSVLDPEGEAPFLAPDEVPEAGDDEQVMTRAVEGVDDEARVLARSVTLPDGTPAAIVVAGSTNTLTRARDRIAIVLAIVGPMVVLVVAGTAWLATGAALRPVRRMSERAARLSLANPAARLPRPPGGDEIAQLGETLNEMLARIAATMAHERAFIDHASHELRTPIAVLRGELELLLIELRDSDTSPATIEAVASALEETDRLSTVAQGLLVLARADAGRLAGERERLSLHDVAEDVVRRAVASETDISIEVSGSDPMVSAERGGLERVIGNLVQNARRFARTRVMVSISDEDGQAILHVADDGPGFAPAVLGRAFDRFTRADDSRNRADGGAGLGLAIVAAEVAALGGRVTAANGEPLGGGRVEVRLPLAPEPPSTDPDAG
jgi:signal transduction histidine kinase